MGKNVYTLGGREYRTKKAVTERCRDLLQRTSFADDEQAFLIDLLGYHHESEQKVGCGVARFYVDRDGYGGRCFWLERRDGTKTDWSFVACLKPPTHEKDVRSALRLLVAPQVIAFRGRALDGKWSVPCAITGTPVTLASAHVDHTPPSTFLTLVERFLAAERRDYASVAVKPTSDGSTATELTELDLAARWRAFHEAHAILRLTLARANLSQGSG